MKKTIFLVLLLFAGSVNADIHIFTNDSLPKTLGAAYVGDTIRFSGTSVTTNTNGLYVQAARVYIDGQGDTLFYGADSSDNKYAIRTDFRADSLVVRNLTMVHDYDGDGQVEIDPDSDSDGTYIQSFNNDAIQLENGFKIDIINCRIVVYGYDVQCVDNYSVAARNITIDSCRFWNYSWGYASRHSYSGSSVRLEVRAPIADWGAGEFSAHIYRSASLISPHAGFAVYSGGVSATQYCKGVEIVDCTTYVDHRNWASGDAATSANAYGILTRFCMSPFRIARNVVRAGTAHGGSRGMIIENTRGTVSDTAKIDSNDCRIWSGPDEENPTGVCRVLRLRGIDGGEWDYVRFLHNHFEAVVDTNDATTHIGINGSVFQFSLDNNSYGHGLFEGNTSVFRPLTQDCDGNAGEFCTFDSYTDVIPLTMRYNKYISGDRIIWIADEGNGGSGDNLLFQYDTLSFLPPGDSGLNYSDKITWRNGYYVEDAENNAALNCYYQNGASDTNIVMWASGPGGDFTLKQRINISVIGTDDSVVINSGVKVTNNYGQVVLNSASIPSGDTLFEFRYFHSYGNGGGTDSIFNPFDVWVWSGSDTTKLNDTVIDWHINCLPIHLISTSGTLDATDTCSVSSPPGGDQTSPNNIFISNVAKSPIIGRK